MPVTLHVDLDAGLWMGVPNTWPADDCASPEEWAVAVAGLLLPDDDGSAADHEILRSILEDLARSRLEFPADRTFAYYGDLAMPFVTVDLALFPAVGDAESRHRALGRVDAPGAVGLVRVEEFATPNLGRGTRVVRFDPQDPEAGSTDLDASARYFWRIDGTDVAVNASFPGPARLLELLPLVEDLVKSITFTAIPPVP